MWELCKMNLFKKKILKNIIARNSQPGELHFCRTRLPSIRILHLRLSRMISFEFAGDGDIFADSSIFQHSWDACTWIARVFLSRFSSTDYPDGAKLSQEFASHGMRLNMQAFYGYVFMDVRAPRKRDAQFFDAARDAGVAIVSIRVSRIFQFVFRVFELNLRNHIVQNCQY